MSSESKIFLSPKLTGDRFEDHTLPVNLLEDFSAFEDLLIELAKKIYLEENPERKRVPKGFTDGVYLKLSNLEDGSTVLNFIIASAFTASTLLSSSSTETFRYIEKARDQIVNIIECASKGEKIHLEQKYLNFFNRIGKNLQDGEAINFAYSANSVRQAILDKKSRKKILLSSDQKHEYTETIIVNALISQIDKKNNFLTFLIDDKEVNSEFDTDFTETIFTAFAEFEKNTLVSLKATGVFNSQEKLIKVEKIESLDVLDPFDISVRLNQLSKLEDNWFEGHGKKLNNDALLKIGEGFKTSYNPKNPLPAIFPTPEGNLQLEWKKGNNEIALEIDLSNYLLNFVFFDNQKDIDYEENFQLRNENDWEKLNGLLEKYL
jgi:hypothetical protein